ncbi:hypothetical protein [Sporolactobacillus sp. KGMB 08714]|uniref:hypothetical protein n=1 Tax=Sporolactobacillus sp. KGMB 08714 TaxID=3064704 RepID=UPI002FBEAA27
MSAARYRSLRAVYRLSAAPLSVAAGNLSVIGSPLSVAAGSLSVIGSPLSVAAGNLSVFGHYRSLAEWSVVAETAIGLIIWKAGLAVQVPAGS